MTSIFTKSGSTFWPTNNENLDIHETLPVGTYIVAIHPQRGYYLEKIESFKMPGKLYGDVMKRAGRIINTFSSRPNSTGLILSGEKGSGKTLLARMLSLELAKQGIITVIVNQAFCGDGFNSLIQSINQPAYVLFDEYEKVYEEEAAQNALLTLFDGLFQSKKLFAITCNNKYGLNSYMMNRPGRFFYAFEYNGLDLAFIREYLEDNLINKDFIESFIRYASTYDAFNFDMLQALVEEMNRYNESVTEAAKYVNVSQSYASKNEYEVVSVKFKEVPENYVDYAKKFYNGRRFNPFCEPGHLYYTYNQLNDDGTVNYVDDDTIPFNSMAIKSFSADGTIHYENEDAIVVIRKVEDKKFMIEDLL